MEITVDRFDSRGLSGWVRGTERAASFRMNIGPVSDVLSADQYRKDLPYPTAFAYTFSDEQSAALTNGAVLALYDQATDRQLAELSLRSTTKPVAFVLPAGEVVGRDSVRWYTAEEIADNVFHYHNIGDSFVYDSSLKIVDALSFFVMDIANVNEAAIDAVNHNCAAVVLRGSNYFHRHMDWVQSELIFSRIKVPIVCLGVGMQAPDGESLALTGKQLRVLQILSDKAVSVGVRGYRTAEELNSFGIKNVDIIGCPTLFRHRNREMRIPNRAFRQIEKVAFNIRREVSDSYHRNSGLYTGIQRSILDQFVATKDVSLMAHGEVEEKVFAFKKQDAYDYVTEKLLNQGWFRSLSDPLVELYRTKLFYSDSVSDYDAFVRKFQLVTGYRLHGNLVALANGIPSFYFVYDERTLEICRTFQIPYFDVRQGEAFSSEIMAQIGNFDKFNANYAGAYQTMIDFLEKNGVPHRL